jgi:hypothetical protein
LPADYERNVFINCPFDAGYAAIFEAIVFAVIVCGFRALCARIKLDSSEFRLNKIMDLIAASKYSIHDLSRVELDEGSALPRFNMPLELGLDLGCKRFSPSRKSKSSLIFDAQPFRFHNSFRTSADRTLRITTTIPHSRSRMCGTGCARIGPKRFAWCLLFERPLCIIQT